MTEKRLLLCTDLDRTLLPNGAQPESPQARDYFRHLTQHNNVTLVYVTGRHRELVEEAIQTYDIPLADFVISDVGTCIHDCRGEDWQLWPEWEQHIDPDWAGKQYNELHEMLVGIPFLKLQETSKQNKHKLSYYLPLDADQHHISRDIHKRLNSNGIQANLVWSIDEPAAVMLLDILPAHAGKLEAIEFLRQQLSYHLEDTLFAGDSGNDISVMASELPAVLVANASDEVRDEAIQMANNANTRSHLYLAQGGLLGMNGNYSAGILEGLIHYHPEFQNWLSNQMG